MMPRYQYKPPCLQITQLDHISIGVYGSEVSSVAQLPGRVVMLQRIRVKRTVRVVLFQLKIQERHRAYIDYSAVGFPPFFLIQDLC